MNNLFVIGVGSGNIDDLTLKAYSLIINSDLVFCDEKAFFKTRKANEY